MLTRDLSHGCGKPPNNHPSGEVYQPNLCARQLGYPQIIHIKFYKGCNRMTSRRDVDDVEIRCSINKINNSVKDLYLSWEPNACNSNDFDIWWAKCFEGVPAGGVLAEEFFMGWTLGLVQAKKKKPRNQ